MPLDHWSNQRTYYWGRRRKYLSISNKLNCAKRSLRPPGTVLLIIITPPLKLKIAQIWGFFAQVVLIIRTSRILNDQVVLIILSFFFNVGFGGLIILNSKNLHFWPFSPWYRSKTIKKVQKKKNARFARRPFFFLWGSYYFEFFFLIGSGGLIINRTVPIVVSECKKNQCATQRNREVESRNHRFSNI